MADITTTISEIQLFIENLKKDMPEVFTQRQNQPALPFVKKLLFRGELYDIAARDIRDSLVDVKLENGQARITCDFAKVHPKNALETWLKAQAEAIIAERAAFWGREMSLAFSKVCVKDQRTLWGSCSGKGNLNFSWRLIKAPPAVLDYLIIHELAHLVHMNHGNEYWNCVAQWCADYKTCRHWLNDHKNELMSDTEVDKIDSPQQQPAPQPPAGGAPDSEAEN